MRNPLTMIVMLVGLFGAAQPVWAIPSFARKYQTSCSTCHQVFPVLNSFGKAFKASGYRIPKGDEDLVKDPPVSLGAPAWKEVFPKAVWPSDIPGSTVAAFWASSQFRVNPSAPITNEFDGLNELYILGAGTLGESLSFLFDLEIIDNGTVPVRFGDALPRAFIQYNHPSRKLNVTYGLFEPRAVLTSTRLRMLRISNYLSNRYGMPVTGNSFTLAPNQRGLELWGNVEGGGGHGGLEWFGGVVNGRDEENISGINAYGPEVQQRTARLQEALRREGRTNFENNSNKDLYVGANYKFGGMGVLGGGRLEDSAPALSSLQDRFIGLGGFYYRGKAPAVMGEGASERLVRDGNTYTRSGVKLEGAVGNAVLLAGAQLNRDRIRGTSRASEAVITLFEARYALYPWLIPAVRFENLNPNYGVAFHRTMVHTSILARANIRLSLEGVISPNRAADPVHDFRRYDSGNDSRFQFRVDFAY